MLELDKLSIVKLFKLLQYSNFFKAVVPCCHNLHVRNRTFFLNFSFFLHLFTYLFTHTTHYIKPGLCGAGD